MDIARKPDGRLRRLKRAGYGAAVVALMAGATLAATRMKPGAPVADASTIWSDVVRRGPMVRQVRGDGTLVPEELRWIAAGSAGRVERVLATPGAEVHPDTIVLELSNPQLEQDAGDAVLRVHAAEAALANLRAQILSDTLQQRSVLAAAESDFAKARMQADMNEALAARQLVSELVRRQSQLDAEQFSVRRQLAEEQLAKRAEAGDAQVAVQLSALAQARAVAALRQQQVNELRVRAGISGVLQTVAVDVGQQVAPGTSLARVADPSRLKAQVRIAETQARDVAVGQKAVVDTHSGRMAGHVSRIDPSVQSGTRTVDVALDEPLPRGAVPDLSIDGAIELERLNDVLFVGRPAFGRDQSDTSLFRLEADGVHATRVAVKLGRSSVDAIEVLGGLREGDRVVLSDMSPWDGVDRVRLQ